MAREIISRLTPRHQEAFDKIDHGITLGASAHITMILDMLLDLSANAHYGNAEKQQYIRELNEYFISTRGMSSYAVVNALKRVETLIFNSDTEEDIAHRTQRAVAQYKKQAAADMETITVLTQRALRDAKTIMLYDYSSTVEKAVCRLPSPIAVIVPESRAIDGGRPFLPPLLQAGHQIRFLPDAAIATALKQTDAVLLGAETYYPDGTAFNTVGSEMAAELCKARDIPCYVLTPTLKCDSRSVQGIFKPVIRTDLRHRLAAGWSFDASQIDFHTSELVPIPPRLITAYITELGIIPPGSLFYLKEGDKP